MFSKGVSFSSFSVPKFAFKNRCSNWHHQARKGVFMAQFNSGYSSSEILSMQRDAMRRVREMQKKSEEKLGKTIPPPPIKNNSPKVNENPLNNINLDKDRLLLLCLFLLLMQEETDPILMLALAYIFF